MSELKRVIHKDSRDTAEKYIRWEYEDVAPMPTPKENKAVIQTQKDVDQRTKDLFFSSTAPTDKEDYIRGARYTNVQFQNLERQKEKVRDKLRTDLSSYSTIKINRINGVNEYTEVQLINADRFQKVSDPALWSVLTLYTGSGHGNQSVGIMVRRKGSEEGTTNTSEDSIG